MVRHYKIDIPEEDEISLDDALQFLDNYIVGTEPVKVKAEFLEEIKVNISWEVVKALEKSLWIENKIDSYAQTWDKHLYAKISHQIKNTQNINELVEILEYLLWVLSLPNSMRNKFYHWKTLYYRLYGNKRAMESQWKNNLPRITISWEKYHIDMKVDIERMRKLAEWLWDYFHQNKGQRKKAA